jgi:sulfonate transport system permease protein
MWTGILVLSIVGTLLNYAFMAVERRLLRWHYDSRAVGGGTP